VTTLGNSTTGPLSYQEALASGVSRRDLDTGELVRVRHGLYVASTSDLTDPDVRLLVTAKAAGGQQYVGGWAAARCYETEALRNQGLTSADDLRVFDGVKPWPEFTGELEPPLLCMNRNANFRDSPGIRSLRSDLDESDIVTLDGLSLTAPLRTAFDLARTRTLWGGVIAVDRLAHLGVIRMDDLHDYVRVQRRRRGVKQVAKVVRLADGRAESPPETVTRLLWLQARLPAPLVNPEIYGRDGKFVARVDLLDAKSKLIVEYDGEHHASAAQRSRDSARRLALEALGYVYVVVTAVDLATPQARQQLQVRLRQSHRYALTR